MLSIGTRMFIMGSVALVSTPTTYVRIGGIIIDVDELDDDGPIFMGSRRLAEMEGPCGTRPWSVEIDRRNRRRDATPPPGRHGPPLRRSHDESLLATHPVWWRGDPWHWQPWLMSSQGRQYVADH